MLSSRALKGTDVMFTTFLRNDGDVIQVCAHVCVLTAPLPPDPPPTPRNMHTIRVLAVGKGQSPENIINQEDAS